MEINCKFLFISIFICVFLSDTKAQGTEVTTATVQEVTFTNVPFRTTLKAENESLYPYKYVTNLQFFLNEANSSRFVAEILYKNLSNHNITTGNLIAVTRADSIDFATVESISKDYNVSVYDVIDINKLETVFKALDISIYSVYKEFMNTLVEDPRTQLPKILEILEIERTLFTDVIIFGNDDDLFNLLKHANLSAASIEEVFNTINLNMEKTYEFLRPILLSKLRLYPMSQFIVDLKRIGVTPEIFASILDRLNIKTIDYYKEGAFNHAFINFVDYLNGNGTVGAVTAPRNIVTNLHVYEKYSKYQDFVLLFAEVVQNQTLRYAIKNHFVFWTNGPVGLETKEDIHSKTIDIAENYDILILNCTYVTVTNGLIVEENIPHIINNNKYLIKIMKNDNVTFKTGSLLVCNDKLYGIAKKEDSAFIYFSTFYWDKKNDENQPSEEFITDKTLLSSSQTNAPALLAIFIVIATPIIM